MNINRKKFIGITGITILGAAGVFYLSSDKKNFTRRDAHVKQPGIDLLRSDERKILYLASLAPSGHNTQPWFVRYIEPYHWIIGNDNTRWLPAVDPIHRETVLSIGAFIQNLEYAAGHFGYTCQWNILAVNNGSENIAEVKLSKAGLARDYDIEKIKLRRTLRSAYLNQAIGKEDLQFLLEEDADSFHYFPGTSKEYRWLNEQTIEANRAQAYRDNAQKELSEWMRFSSRNAERRCDGLTTAGMEIDGIEGWIMRNFFTKSSVMKTGFREKGIDKVREQVSHSGGWILITSRDDSVASLLEAGKRMQRLFLNVREKRIGLHPMTQILEEDQTNQAINQSIGISDQVQFLLRAGYVKNYPDPVSLRRPVDWFLIS